MLNKEAFTCDELSVFSLVSPTPHEEIIFMQFSMYVFLFYGLWFMLQWKWLSLFWGWKLFSHGLSSPSLFSFFAFTFLILWNSSWCKVCDTNTALLLERWLSSGPDIICGVTHLPHWFKVAPLSFKGCSLDFVLFQDFLLCAIIGLSIFMC